LLTGDVGSRAAWPEAAWTEPRSVGGARGAGGSPPGCRPAGSA